MCKDILMPSIIWVFSRCMSLYANISFMPIIIYWITSTFVLCILISIFIRINIRIVTCIKCTHLISKRKALNVNIIFTTIPIIFHVQLCHILTYAIRFYIIKISLRNI